MKRILFIAILASFFACNTKPKPHHGADTSIVFGGFINPNYGNAYAVDTMIILSHDTAKLVEGEVVNTRDSFVYARMAVYIPDSTGKKAMKTKEGKDSMIISYLPIPAVNYINTLRGPIKYKHP
jgi:hypothetical protein